MKYFESDRTGRLVVTPFTEARAVQQSVDEALRILAETEQGADACCLEDCSAATASLYTEESTDWVDCTEFIAGTALAESLARFITEPSL